jgi:hypothetical protein
MINMQTANSDRCFTGLLPLLKSIHKRSELKKYDGLTLGVDAYGWLHRAAHSCAVELGQGKPTTKSALLQPDLYWTMLTYLQIHLWCYEQSKNA